MAATARKLTTNLLTRRLLLFQQRHSQGQTHGHGQGQHQCRFKSQLYYDPIVNRLQVLTCRNLSSQHQHDPKSASPKSPSVPLQDPGEEEAGKVSSKTRKKTKQARNKEDLMYEPHEIFEMINWAKLLDSDPVKRQLFQENLERRQADVDLDRILKLYESVIRMGSIDPKSELLEQLVFEVLKIPNDTHPGAWSRSDTDVDSNIIHLEGEPGTDEKQEFYQFCKHKNLVRTDNLGNLTGSKGYFLKGPLAELEQALIRFTVDALVKNGFELLSVPDIAYPRVVESCGFPTKGDRNQIYFLPGDPNIPNSESCLLGTSEMAIGGFLHNRVFSMDELPLKLAAVSRCYRAETSTSLEEGGIFRVHYFTKVEMFGVTSQGNHPSNSTEPSNALQETFRKIQQDLFNQCAFHYRVLDMPPSDLGASAHRKFDIEAWMPGRKMFGEISSCSNCTDYQSRRLNIRYVDDEGVLKFAHTVNGTACAVPRMLISLVENHQCADGTVEIPPAIQHFMTRSWKESAALNPNVEFNFLRTKSQQDRVTAEYL